MKEKIYTVGKNYNGDIEVSYTDKSGFKRSVCSPRVMKEYTNKNGEVCKRVERRTETIKRLCDYLGIEY